ncbi:ABC transporter family substrate-binding protein [Nocardia huaxiensis]|uniref:ABC transporter family substrate-binding protein n=1 Tax=Nocardia huaxiensis TaxID=2755382 RepID=A0A7D6ZI53_9NOCA|nr:ABC transporter family substrate-binding protein [Nocardia huaxiensis]QLY31147.1 ABC transporter family substrate-binding protein [Nocardia huaxiensis]UFS94677.1 ABC transporter family substrate-binding protein [Nocardia huaxiensis]
MRIRSTVTRLAIPMVALGLVLTGCSSNTGPTGTSDIGTTNDINAHPVEDLKQGGNLRLDLSALPESFNYLHVDGNTGDTSDVVLPLLPTAYNSDAAGNLTINHDYFTDIQLAETNPQKVIYTINPKAVWSDGTPITWEDMRAQWKALSGENPEYLISAQLGFNKVASVERGVDDRQAIVTFREPHGEWQGQYGLLYPKAMMESPQTFNDWARSNLPVSAGPFIITAVDRTQNRITLGRNPKWWGDTPVLDTITFSVLDSSARIGAIQNNEIDATDMGSLSDIVAARNTPGIQVRRTSKLYWSHLTFNGAPGSLLSDVNVRRAVAKAIDRQAIVNNLQNGIVTEPKVLNNHVYMAGQKGYQDNSASVAYNPEAAAKELEALGWIIPPGGDVREKDGRKLILKDVMYQQDSWIDAAKIVQDNLQKIGVKVEIQTVPGQGLFTDVIDPGNYDLAQYSYGGSVQPLEGLRQFYYYDPANWVGNKARIGSPELNKVIDAALAELDPAKAIELANQADTMIFEEVHSLPWAQSAGNTACRESLANWGAFGMASVDYTKVGFLK